MDSTIKVIFMMLGLVVLTLGCVSNTPSPSSGADVVDVLKPKLWEADINYSLLISFDNKYQEYIMPYNPTVLYYSTKTSLKQYTYFYVNPYYSILIDDTRLLPDDNDDFDMQYYGQDYWMNPDYFLTHGRIGDCEDWHLAYLSLLKAKGHKVMVVMGFQDMFASSAHLWGEVVIEDKVYVLDYSSLIERDEFYKENSLWRKVYMFNDEVTIRNYESKWNERY